MSCTNCNKTYPLPICCEVITIGVVTLDTVVQEETEVRLLFTNISSNAQFSVTATTDTAGLLVIETETIASYFNPHDTYEIKVLPVPTQNESGYDILIDEIYYECLRISFFFGGDDTEPIIKVQ